MRPVAGGRPPAPRPSRALALTAACVLAGAVAVLVALTLSTAAVAAPSIYWTYEDFGAKAVGAMFMGGIGGGAYETLFTESERTAPEGIVLDPATNKVYWADDEAGKILVGGMGGEAEGGPTTLVAAAGEGTSGLAIDAPAGKLYWTDEGTNEIRSANIDGTEVKTLFRREYRPVDIAVDAKTGELFWTDNGSGDVRLGGVGGEAEGAAVTLYEGEGEPAGIAVESQTGKLFWTDASYNEIRVGGIKGAGAVPASTLFKGEGAPVGIAIDPSTDKLYWADYNTGLIRVGGLGGESEGPATTLFENGDHGPNFLALLGSPVGSGAPTVAGVGAIGEPLSCSQGAWAGDLRGVFFYEAPRSFAFRWDRNGTALGEATGSTFTPTEAGSYTCQVTATNHAGSTSQVSAPVVVPPPSEGDETCKVTSPESSQAAKAADGTEQAVTPGGAPFAPVSTDPPASVRAGVAGASPDRVVLGSKRLLVSGHVAHLIVSCDGSHAYPFTPGRCVMLVAWRRWTATARSDVELRSRAIR